MAASSQLVCAQEAPQAPENEEVGVSAEIADKPTTATSGPKKVKVIPIRSGINKPALFLLRRGLKDAIEADVDTVLIDMKTPGGYGGIMLEMMEALDKFPGETITYVNNEATSAGALISSVTDRIYFSPRATMGASEVVSATGADINESMKRKIDSFMRAKIRSYTEGEPFRAEVMRAMMDPEFELKIEGNIIKEKGELLSITATEATALYGEPPVPLIAEGVAEDIDGLLDQVYGADNYSIQRYEPSWSEGLAQWITTFTPALLALGLLGLFIEFKTPGFGVFGVTGLILVAIFFFGHHVAGLSGFEPMLLLLLGLALIAVEIFLVPGTLVAGIAGAAMVLVSLVWAMLDIWPDQPLELNSELLMRPLINLTLGIAGAIILMIALLRYLPHSGPWGGMVLQTAIAGAPDGIHPVHAPAEEGMPQSELVGSKAVAATDLYPSGQVTIGGKRYEARLEVGSVDAGTPLVVTRVSGFGLIVEELQPEASS